MNTNFPALPFVNEIKPRGVSKVGKMTRHLECALMGSALTAFVIFLWQRISRVNQLKTLKDSFLDDASFSSFPATPTPSTIASSSAELDNEQLSRMTLMVGEAGLKRVKSAKMVVVVGVGGVGNCFFENLICYFVGSHAAVHLVRSGVERIRLVDFDQVIKYPNELSTLFLVDTFVA